jgi:hypothetical protein
MKVDVSEQTAALAVAQLRESADPNVKALVRSLDRVLQRPAPLRLDADELEATILAVEYTLETTGMDTAGQEDAAQRALPKLRALFERERTRAHAGPERT